MNARTRLLVAGPLAAAVLAAAAAWLVLAGSGGATHARNPLSFRPDATTVGSCRAAQATTRTACYAQAYGNVAYRHSAIDALGQLNAATANDGDLARGCHAVTHSIGAATLERFHGDVHRALAAGDRTCNAGFFHGVLQQRLLDSAGSDVSSVVRSACAGSAATAAGDPAACAHGLGHGVLIWAGYNLPAALRQCDVLDATGARACYGGALMENFTTTYAHTTRWNTGAGVHPCDQLASRYADACYFALGDRLAQQADPPAAFQRTCPSAPAAWRATCFRSLGAHAALAMRAQPSRLAGICLRFAPGYSASCAAGAASTLAAYAHDARAAAPLCAALQGTAALACTGAARQAATA